MHLELIWVNPHMHLKFKCIWLVTDNWPFCPYVFGEYSLTICIWALCCQWYPYAFGTCCIDSMHLGIMSLTKCIWVSFMKGYPYAFGKYGIDSMHLGIVSFTKCIWGLLMQRYPYAFGKTCTYRMHLGLDVISVTICISRHQYAYSVI